MSPASNLLRQETSPYLLQHADNPVHWRPWGQAALAEARETDRPILLSVGYAACHWCHVMAHESFEDAETAADMNALFVNIKVDREERPDIDQLYMSALHALGEQGGWPLTMFLTPHGEPFWGGTYFPPEPRWGRPSFRQVLAGVSAAYRDKKADIAHNTGMLAEALAAMSALRPGEGITPTMLDDAAARLLRGTDPDQGGLRGSPKFPNPPLFRFLFQNDFRANTNAGRDALHLLLTRISAGGIYDHLGGGYARYATDSIWLVPHFEKMLYDNGQLLELLALAHADRPDPVYAERAEETVGWLDRDMTAAADANGNAAYAASEDADSEGEEGRFYVWLPAEVDRVLGPDSAVFRRAYDIADGGNWEGNSIPRRITPRGTGQEEARLASCRAKLLEARAQRVRPGRDDKLLTDWNGLAIAGLARAAAVFDRPAWLARAAAAYRFLQGTLLGQAPTGAAADGRVAHAWRLGRITAAGLLDDQASLARAALALHEATGEPAYLRDAIGLARAALDHFADADGAFYITAADASDVPLGAAARPRTATDTVLPSGNGMMAEVFARLYHLTGDPAWRGHAQAVLRAFSGKTDALSSMPTLLGAADLLEEAAVVVVVGAAESPATAALRGVTVASPDPATVVLAIEDGGSLPADHPAHGKRAPADGAAAYVCRAGVCSLPVTDPVALAQSLRTR